jgi:hypothetical protein
VEAAAAAAEPAAKPAGRPAPPDIANWTGTWEELEQAKLEYSERLTDWKLEQAHQAGATEAKRSQQLESQKAINAKWEATAAASTHPDFQDAIASVGPFITEAGVADLIKGSDVGGEILMYMHEHQDETLAMARLGNPVAIAREIGKLEARLTPPKTKPAAAAQPLPKPPAAIDSATAPVTVDLDKADMTTFKRAMGKILAG